MKKTIKIWDLPVRLFHWLLVAAMIGLFVTGWQGGNLIEWHGKLGLAVVGLLAFRLVWGFCGSTYARFLQFFPKPAAILAYLKGSWHGLGHNPLGALSVFALLGLSALQVGTGLFTDDEIAFKGMLAGLIDPDLAVTITGYHKQLSYVLLGLSALHVASMLFYWIVKKNNLLWPMVTGKKQVEAGESCRGGGWLALLCSLVIAAAAVYAASGAWIPAPPPPPPPPSETPAPVFDF